MFSIAIFLDKWALKQTKSHSESRIEKIEKNRQTTFVWFFTSSICFNVVKDTCPVISPVWSINFEKFFLFWQTNNTPDMEKIKVANLWVTWSGVFRQYYVLCLFGLILWKNVSFQINKRENSLDFIERRFWNVTVPITVFVPCVVRVLNYVKWPFLKWSLMALFEQWDP